MSELTDAFQALVATLRHQYYVCKPLVLHQLQSLTWSLRLSLLSMQEDLLRPFRTYTDHVLLLDSPDAQGWQTCIHVAEEEVMIFRIQHKAGRKMSHGVKLAARPRGDAASPRPYQQQQGQGNHRVLTLSGRG